MNDDLPLSSDQAQLHSPVWLNWFAWLFGTAVLAAVIIAVVHLSEEPALFQVL